MWGKRTFILAAIVLTLTLVANADLVLTLNGLDAAKESAETEGKDNLVIAVAGNTDVDPNAYYIKATGGTLEAKAGPNTLGPQAYKSEYSFTFEDESGLGVVSLIANNDMIIDGTSVKEGDTIYELVLFYISETDTVTAFSVNLESLSCIPPELEPGPEPQPVPELQPESEPEPEAEAQPEPEPAPKPGISASSAQDTVANEDISAADKAEDFNLPLSGYWQDEQWLCHPAGEKRQKHLMHCPAGSDDNSETFSKAAYEAYMKNRSHEDIALESTAENSGSPMSMESNEPNIIVIDSDITTNQIWTADNIYYVTSWVKVQALLVIEPGTTIYFSYDNYAAMFINNGGTLISCGTPDNPIIYTSDTGYGWGDYYCAIYIEQTASPSTKVTYSYIDCALVAIVIDNIRLDTPIENNYLFYNAYGIGENGTHHTDIMNNLIFYTYNSGIDVYMASDFGAGIADANSHILIQNNTCDYYQDCGITIHGVPDSNDAGMVVLANNVVSESYWYGLNLVDGYMYAMVFNTGYYGNYMNKNWEFEETNPVEANEFPYVEGPVYFDVCYLDQNCPFIDAGLQYIEQTSLIGKTTDVNKLPDCNYVDLGFHYPNWNFSNPSSGDSLSADLDDNMTVDFKDFAIFANYWQQSTSGEADLDDSGFVDYNDLSILAGQWLQVAEPNIQIHIYGDSNEGYVDIGVTGFTSDTLRVFLLLDGQYMGEMFFFQDGKTFDLDISALGSGTHEIKAISTSTLGKIICSNVTETSFTCPFHYCLSSDAYDSNEPHYFCAYYSGSNDISVKVYNEENNLVWSQTYTAESLCGSIPANITSADDLDSVVFEEIPSGGVTVLNSVGSVAKPLGLKFNPKKVPANIRALIIVPSWIMRNITDIGVIEAVKETFETRGVPYRYLKGSQASYAVLAWYGANRNIDYIYYCDHGGYKHGNVLRSTINLSDGWAVSVKQSDFAPGQAPSWCEKLPGSLEATVNSMYRIGFTQGELKFVHFDCCFTGRLKLSGNKLEEGQSGQQGLFDLPHSDMSWALKMQSSWTQVFQGWWGEVPKGSTSKFNHFAYHEWTKLGEGDNLYNALMYAITETDWIPNGPHDNYRLKGQGYLTDLRIE